MPKRASSKPDDVPMITSKRMLNSATEDGVTKPVPRKAAAKKATPPKKTAPVKAAPVKAAPSKAAPTKAAGDTNAASMNTSRKRKAAADMPEAKPAKRVTTGKAAPKKAEPKKSTVKKAAPKKADAIKAPAKKTTSAGTAAAKAAPSKKRKAVDEAPAEKPAKAPKPLAKGPVINEPPTQRLHVFVFGEGSAGELGLGTKGNAIDVSRPRLNPNLAADKVGVVQIVAGGMHTVALTADNKILTWGVNDNAALGRDTEWSGGLKDMDAADGDQDNDEQEDDDDTELNPKESNPAEVNFSDVEIPNGTRWVQVAAGDSCSFALTDDGKVYGWGTFRGGDGGQIFAPGIEVAKRPVLIPDLKKITSIGCGSNHAVALDSTGAVFAWGSGEQDQLGRRVSDRNKDQSRKPYTVGFPRGVNKTIASISTGPDHTFAVSKKGDVYSWGLNNWGQTGIVDGAGEGDSTVPTATRVEALNNVNIASIGGGGHFSIAATSDGDCLAWGRCEGGQLGIPFDELERMDPELVKRNERGKLALVTAPTKVSAIQGRATVVAAGQEHSIVVTQEGKAWSSGFSSNYQTGLGTSDDVLVATMMDNRAIRETKLNGVFAGGQFGILTAAAE